MKEFKNGFLTCVAGKYNEQAKLTVDFNQLECPVPKDYTKVATEGTLSSELWEIKIDDNVEYTCLNPKCSGSIQTYLHSLILYPLGFLVKLVVVSVFSMGLSMHTKAVENHYKAWHTVVFSALSLLGLTGYGVKLMMDDARQFEPLLTNPNASWVLNDKIEFPIMSS